jgi:glutathione S-transferase
MARLHAALARGPYVMGNMFTGPDLLIGSAFAFGRRAFPADEAFDAYVERCRSRSAVLCGLALDDRSYRRPPERGWAIRP